MFQNRQFRNGSPLLGQMQYIRLLVSCELQAQAARKPQTVAAQTRDKIFNGVPCADLICVRRHNKKPRVELLTTVHCGASGYIYTMPLNRTTTRCFGLFIIFDVATYIFCCVRCLRSHRKFHRFVLNYLCERKFISYK